MQSTHFHVQHHIYHCVACSLDSEAFSVALFAFVMLKKATEVLKENIVIVIIASVIMDMDLLDMDIATINDHQHHHHHEE